MSTPIAAHHEQSTKAASLQERADRDGLTQEAAAGSVAQADAPIQVVRRRRVISRRLGVMLGLATVLSVVFLSLAFMLRLASGTAFDVAITRAAQSIDAPAFTAAMVGISAIGYAPWTWVMLGIACVGLLAAGLWREALFVLATEGAGWLVAFVKTVVERPRPTPDLVDVASHLGDYSFPSGHVVGYVVLYGFLFFVLYVRFKRSWLRTAALTVLGALVALVGLSRIHLGYHWASDVLGGYAFGTAYLLVMIELYRLVTPEPASRMPSLSSDPSSQHGGSTMAATGGE